MTETIDSVPADKLEMLAAALREAAAAENAPTPVRITLADKAAGRGPEIAEQARREGRPVEVEILESPARKGIRQFAESTSREAAIAAGRAAAGGFRK